MGCLFLEGCTLQFQSLVFYSVGSMNLTTRAFFNYCLTEIQQLAVSGHLRAIALASTEALDLVTSTASPGGQSLVVPVGIICQGRILNVVGSSLDMFITVVISVGLNT